MRGTLHAIDQRSWNRNHKTRGWLFTRLELLPVWLETDCDEVGL